MYRCNLLLAFLAQKQVNVLLVVLEKVLRQHCRAVRVSTDSKVLGDVLGIGHTTVAFQSLKYCFVPKILRQSLALCGCVHAYMGRKASRLMPFAVASCCIVVDRDKQYVLGAYFLADVVHTLAAYRQCNVLLLFHNTLCIVAHAAKLVHNSRCNLSCIRIFTQPFVRAAFAGGVHPMPIVD